MTLLRPLLCFLPLLLASCSPISDAWMSGWTQGRANDRIMYVRQEPPSFGYHRLAIQSRLHPDFGFFLKKRGLPEFLAEIDNRDRHYFILYYLPDRQAFACRTQGAGTQEIEISGPYPITQHEYKTLSDFRRQVDHPLP